MQVKGTRTRVYHAAVIDVNVTMDTLSTPWGMTPS
jgi:hypothetical protein